MIKLKIMFYCCSLNCLSEKYFYKITGKNFSIETEIENEIENLRAIIFFNGENLSFIKYRLNMMQSRFGAIYMFDLLKTFTNSEFIQPNFYFEDESAIFETKKKLDVGDSLIFIYSKSERPNLLIFQIVDIHLSNIELYLETEEKNKK